jgi:hypothetical protein
MSAVSKIFAAIKWIFGHKDTSLVMPTYDVPITVELQVHTSEISDEEFAARKAAAAQKRKEWNALGKEEHLNILGQRSRERALSRRNHQMELGVTEAIWLYSGAPCDIDPKNPQGNQDASHKAANGNRFKIAEGMFLDGKWTWPGHEDGCRCVSRAVIPALEDGRYNKQ